MNMSIFRGMSRKCRNAVELQSNGGRILVVIDALATYSPIFHYISQAATGCAVAQHCYNGDVSILREKWKLWPPVKSKPLNRLTHNLSGLIRSTRWTFIPNLVKIRSRGLLGKGVKYNSEWLIYLFIFFSRTNVEKRPLDGFWRAMAQKTRNRARMCLLGAIKWRIEIWTLFNPQNPVKKFGPE